MILRGLRERTRDIKQKAAATCGNICALVDDVRDLTPFVPTLQPELVKCEEHTHPDLRECATKAKEGLLKGLSLRRIEVGGEEAGRRLRRRGARRAVRRASKRRPSDPVVRRGAGRVGHRDGAAAGAPQHPGERREAGAAGAAAAPASPRRRRAKSWDEALVAAAQSAVLEYKGLGRVRAGHGRAEGLHRGLAGHHPGFRGARSAATHQLLAGARQGVRHRRPERHRKDDAPEPGRREGHRRVPRRRLRVLHPARDFIGEAGDDRGLHGGERPGRRDARDGDQHPERSGLRRRQDGGDDPVPLSAGGA